MRVAFFLSFTNEDGVEDDVLPILLAERLCDRLNGRDGAEHTDFGGVNIPSGGAGLSLIRITCGGTGTKRCAQLFLGSNETMHVIAPRP